MEIFHKKEACSGCTACEHICPVNAIAMQPDLEGFLYPEIDQNACTECGLCVQICPMKQAAEIKNEGSPHCYAAISTDDQNRLQSSSGGIFTPLSDFIFSQNGLVAGALFDDSWTVVHALTADRSVRDRMKGSKYVQSELSDIFMSIHSELSRERKILFTGTPCQTDGLRAYLFAQNADLTHLYLCDLLCLGAPSPKLFCDYLAFLEQRYQKKISDFHFRTKNLGWKKRASHVAFDGTNYDDEINSNYSFLKIYSSLMANRPSCYACPYTRYERDTDLTLGDFWTVQSSVPEMDDDRGTSLVLVHSEKGAALLDAVKDKIRLKEVSRDSAWSLALEKPRPMPKKRADFWQDYQLNGIESVVSTYGKGTLFVNFIHKITPFFRRTGIYDIALKVYNRISK